MNSMQKSMELNEGRSSLYRGCWFFNSAMADADVTGALELTDSAMKAVCGK